MTDHLQTIAAAFASAVLSQQHRPLRLRWRPQETRFAQWLLVQRVDIEEAWLDGLQAKLTCVSSDPELPLQALLGQPLGIEMVTDRGGLHHTNGIITEARAGQADGALRIYQLTLKDALSIMEERINTRIFRQLSVSRILEIMLGEWRQRSPALAAAFHFDLHRLENRRYPVREISHQFNESDAHFIRRLCRREGIGWYIASAQPADDTGKPADAGVPMHTLVFCDYAALLPQAAAGTVRYHRTGATEQRDTINAWSRQRSLVPGRVWRGSWDYKAVRVDEVASQNVLDQGDAGRALACVLDDGLIEAPHTADGQQDHLRMAHARMMAHEGRSESFEASGTVRDLAVGHWFVLEGHPDLRGHDRTLREFIVTSLRQQAENNFPKALQDAIERLLPASMANNTPGYGKLDAQQVKRIRHHERLSGKSYEAGLSPQERRDHFNALWFFEATHGTHPHLTFKVRAGDADKVRQSLAEERSARLSMTEHQSLVQASTAHQKTILIDYDHAQGEHAVGYVMGLNSVTDYWDTRRHLFYDPRRGQSWEGGGDELPGLKPLQDYACRICGEALISVSKNFVDAWNRVADEQAPRSARLHRHPHSRAPADGSGYA